jgi:ssDNA thymidine ADP-ribosyltransferase, DarT
MVTPANPKIYHIIHIDRLASIAQHGIFSDAAVRQAQGLGTVIGMSTIKDRRLQLPVSCHPGTMVGDYVPFYLCSRSIMLYVIHCANHVELAYRGGQGPIIHLEADLHEVVAWANGAGIRWAFTSANAGAYYTPFFNAVGDLESLNWEGIAARDFRPSDVKEAKQSEFLVHHSFPWHLIRRIGVLNLAVANQAHALTAMLAHRPPIEIQPGWYY